ncbi:MAG: FadR/GntR family transcriptional regulator [Cellvibrionaceae bacterium]
MKAQSRSLTQSIVQDLGQAIVCGTYSSEKPFPIEADLCTQFGVSRSVLREAVKMLTSKGLLSARPRQGTWVEPESNWNLLDPSVMHWLLDRKFSIDLLLEFTQVRLAIEPQAAEFAALSGDEDAMAQIDAAIDRMDAAAKGDDDPLLSDIAFHVAVLQASGNRFFMQLEDLIDTALRISIRFTNQYKGVVLADVDAHRAVAEAIRKGDAALASSAMKVMLSEALELMTAAKEERAKSA